MRGFAKALLLMMPQGMCKSGPALEVFNMRSRYVIGALAAALLIGAASASDAALKGKYTLGLFDGPSHGSNGTQCLLFHPTGNIHGFSNGPGWGGNFIVDHGVLRAYSTWGGGTGVINLYVNMSTHKGGFDDWLVGTTLPLTATYDGWVTLTRGCPTTFTNRPNSGDDPAKVE